MGQVQHVSDIAFSTAFLTDKTCGLYTGSILMSSQPVYQGQYFQFTIPHTLTRPALPDLITLNDVTAQGSYDNSVCIAYSDATNFYILSPLTVDQIVYRLVTTWIDDYDTTNPLITPVLQTSDTGAYFDSRQNYPKLLVGDVATVVGTGSIPIQHNLGYLPTFKVYIETVPGQIWPAISGGAQDPWLYDSTNQYEVIPTITTSTLTLDYSTGFANTTPARIWYKIYYDA